MSRIECTTYQPHTADASGTPATTSKILRHGHVAPSKIGIGRGDLARAQGKANATLPGAGTLRFARRLDSTADENGQSARGCPRGLGRSDHCVAAQLLDLGRAVARLAEDLIGVLAERRRLALDARAAVRESKSCADQAHRP